MPRWTRPRVARANYSRFWDEGIVERRRNYPAVSDTLIKALEKYVKDRIPTGGFLRAVLENDLATAVAYADGENILILDKIVGFARCAVPIIAQGDEDKVRAWLAGVEDQLKAGTQQHLKIEMEERMVDYIATDDLEVEFQRETGFSDRLKLYVHRGGRTIVRICKLKYEQVAMVEDAIPFINLR